MVDNEADNDKTSTHIVLTKGTMVSHYRIVEKIGAGGMGEVYLAEDTKLKRRIALKFLPAQYASDPDFKARFVREAEATAMLNHPNIVTIFEVSEYKGQPFLAMELVEGESLHKLTAGKNLSIEKIIDLTIQICDGLSAAHEKKIVHRDIKPANIVIDSYGHPKILDFGLATIQGGEHLTKTGSTLGTVGYMSPEQVSGKETDHRSDLFSIGVVFYELIAGKTPFKRDNEGATLRAIIEDNPEPLTRYKSDIPSGIQSIIEKALDKDIETRYQSAAGIVADLKREKKLLESGRSASLATDHPPQPAQKKSKFRYIISGSLTGILILLILIFKPWKFEVSPTQDAVASENRLAIMYFENLADPEDSQRLGEIATNLLITDLSESRYVQVVSSQRLYDILKLLGKEGVKVLDREVATQVATKAGAKQMLLGSILQVKPQIVITAQLVEVATGNVVASQRITGAADEQIFSLIDKLTVEIKNDLSLPEAAQEEPDRPVADFTTHSPEAYRYVLEGIDYISKLYNIEAEISFRKAVELDSTFAMAYYFLSGFVLGTERKEMMDKAVKYSDKASERERYYISSKAALMSGDVAQSNEDLKSLLKRYPDEKMAHYLIGVNYILFLRQPKDAIRHLNKAIEIDPLFKEAYNLLAYTYENIGEFEKSIWAINKYIALAPDEANPYDSRGDLYAYNGKLDKAIESYKNAVEIKPDFSMSLAKLGDMFLFKREYKEAEYWYQRLASGDTKSSRSAGRTRLALIPIFQGKFEQALNVLDDGIAADRMEQAKGSDNANKHFVKATIYQMINKPILAVKEAEICLSIQKNLMPESITSWTAFYIYHVAKSGQIEEAQRLSIEFKEEIEDKDPNNIYPYWRALGTIEQEKGNPDSALTLILKSEDKRSTPFFQMQIILAEIYLDLDRLGDAVAVLEKALLRYDKTRAGTPIMSVKAHYILGLAYERSGWNNKAIEQYEEFLNYWKEADSGIAEIEDAKQRIARLGS